jgi:hypothetical protein
MSVSGGGHIMSTRPPGILVDMDIAHDIRDSHFLLGGNQSADSGRHPTSPTVIDSA